MDDYCRSRKQRSACRGCRSGQHFSQNPEPLTGWLIPWHQDTALPLATPFTDRDWGSKEGIRYAHAPARALSRVVALRVHLDASSGENGPLRVVPGSHQVGALTDQGVMIT
jgi:hypothetical protein